MARTRLARRILAVTTLAAVAAGLATASPRAAAAGGTPANLAPDQGALFGAWTKPRSGRTAGQELAFGEQQIGRKFDLYHLYYHIDKALPTKDMVDAAGSGHTVLMAFDPDPVNS